MGGGITADQDDLGLRAVGNIFLSANGAERVRITESGNAEFTGGITAGGNLDFTDTTCDLYSQTTTSSSKTFQLFSDIGGTKTEKVFIQADGSASLSGRITAAGFDLASLTALP